MLYQIENYESMQSLILRKAETAIRQRLDRRLWGLFIEILNIIEYLSDGINENELIKRIFNDEKAGEKIARLLNKPEKQNIAV